MEINSKWFVKDYSGIVFQCCPLFAMDTRNVIKSVYSVYTVTIQMLSSPMLISFAFDFVVFSEIVLVQVFLSEIIR